MSTGYKHVRKKKSLCRNRFGRNPDWSTGQTVVSALDDGRHPLRTALFIRSDSGFMPQREPDVVEALQQPPTAEIVEREGPCSARRTYFPGLQVHGYRQRGVGFDRVPERFHDRQFELHRQQPVLECVAPEDIPEPR